MILSIDIASGVDGDGQDQGNCIKADATVTFHLPKIGMFLYPGAEYIGELTVADIGIPYALAENMDTPWLMERHDIRGILPARPMEGHKGTFGKPLIIAGSQGMTGAAYLNSLSAYRTGSGFSCCLENCLETLCYAPEAVTHVYQNSQKKKYFILLIN